MNISSLSCQMVLVACVALFFSACAPEVGSERWCNNLKEKPKGDWSMNEAANFTKHCVFK